MRAIKKKSSSAPCCCFCGRSGAGIQFAIFNPRFKPLGTACVPCEESLPEGTPVDLMTRFAGTCAEFQAELTGLAKTAGKTVAHVYALWREYAAKCDASDQSALVFEFRQWYAKELNLPCSGVQSPDGHHWGYWIQRPTQDHGGSFRCLHCGHQYQLRDLQNPPPLDHIGAFDREPALTA